MFSYLSTKIAAAAISVCLLALSLFAQSGVKPPPHPSPTPPSDETSKEKSEPLPVPDIKYEVIGPKTVVDFMYALKAAGKRGFRLDKITALPTGMGQTRLEQIGMTVLAGIVKFDGTAIYDYNFFSAESYPEPDNK